jgi:CubicO group peptidase (beta-lactamase class C family)
MFIKKHTDEGGYFRMRMSRGWIAAIFAVMNPLLCCVNGSVVEDRTDRLDKFFREVVFEQQIPGAVAYIKSGDKMVFHGAYGFKDIESNQAMETDSIFRMASMTKALTAVAILQLVEQGKIFLDDELWHYIPEFKGPAVLVELEANGGYRSRPASSEITLRQLLTHTSGLGYGFQNEDYNTLVLSNDVSEGFEDDERTSMENSLRIAGLPLLHDPGEDYTYGLSYEVLGTVIEVVTGMRYDKYIQENILKPLEMKDSYFLVPESERHRLVTVYEYSNDGRSLKRASYPDTEYPISDGKNFFAGGSDLCSTAEDYAKFIQMIVNGGVHGKQRILGKRFIEMMLQPQTKFNDGKEEQGFAAWVMRAEGAAVGPKAENSFGFGGFFDTYGWADPDNGFIAVLLLQMYPNNEYRIHERFQAITYGVIDYLEEMVE